MSKSIYKARDSVNVYQTRFLSHAHSNSQPLRLQLSCSLVSVLRRSCGSLFQIVGPHTRKLRQPNRVERARGTTVGDYEVDRNPDYKFCCNCNIRLITKTDNSPWWSNISTVAGQVGWTSTCNIFSVVIFGAVFCSELTMVQLTMNQMRYQI